MLGSLKLTNATVAPLTFSANAMLGVESLPCPVSDPQIVGATT